MRISTDMANRQGTNLSIYAQVKLNAVARQLNERSRRMLAFKHQQNDLLRVLRRSIELATGSGLSEQLPLDVVLLVVHKHC
jgi:hypothetical protein